MAQKMTKPKKMDPSKQTRLMKSLKQDEDKSSENTFKKEALTQSWTQGKIEEGSKNVIKAPPSRGGHYRLFLNEDGTAEFRGGLSCGFGAKRIGTWTLNEEDQTIALKYTQEVGYMNNPKDEAIDIAETYKITKLSENQMILESLSEQLTPYSTMPFIKMVEEK